MNNHPIYLKLLEYVRAWRIKHNLSQHQMAKLIGIKQSNYAKFENNQLDIKVSALLRLLDVTEINQEELMKKLDAWQGQLPKKKNLNEGDIKLLTSIFQRFLEKIEKEEN